MFARKIYEPLAKALAENGIDSPLGIQKLCFSKIKGGADIHCVSGAGSGKSAIIAISIVQQLKSAVDDVPRALVTVPDAESAHAMKTVFDVMAHHTDLRVFDAHEEVNTTDLYHDIYAGSDVVIGTASRFGELYTKNIINLAGLRMFAIDDADMIIRQDELSQIFRISETSDRLQVLLFANKNSSYFERYIEQYVKTREVIS